MTVGRLDPSYGVTGRMAGALRDGTEGRAMDDLAFGHGAWFGRLRELAVALAVALAVGGLVAGCSVASLSPAATPGETPSPTPSPTPALAPTPAPTPLIGAGTAPAGEWTGVRWIAAGPVFPQTPVPVGGNQSSVQITMFGWSGGYVGFRNASSETLSDAGELSGTWAMVSTASADGLHWTPGRALDGGEMGSWIFMSGVVEGPAGLLAVGRKPTGVCGGPATVGALWTSPDGGTWTRVQLPSDFASASVYTVDAGSAGYIATGMLEGGVTPAVWVSADGRSWHRTSLPKPASGKVFVDGGTALAGGYILSGAQRIDVGCGMSEFIPSLWWSADGSSWTPGKVPGAMPAGYAWVTVNRISDHAVMADAQQWDADGQELPRQVWVTHDGRTWKLVASPSSLLNSSILTNGQRGLIAGHQADGFGAPVISTVDDDLTVKTLSQSGDGPVDSETSNQWMAALGPAGVVILSQDGANLWLGVPTAS